MRQVAAYYYAIDRFKIITENEKFKWKLPRSMTNYANKEYIPEDTLKEATLYQNFKGHLESKTSKKGKKYRKYFGKASAKNCRSVDVMSPLSKLWNILEGTKRAEEDTVQISINDLLHYVEQNVLLLGQTSNAITYHRRLNVLGSVVNSQYRVKTMLKEMASLLQRKKKWQTSIRKKVQEQYF